MIVLDTNVSEAMKPEPNPVVLIWLMTRRRKPLYISTVTLAELLSGIQALPQGRRWHLLDGTLNALLGLSRDRMLSFATEAVWCYAELAVAVRNGGVASRRWNGYIVAIAASRGFIAASRDTAPFEAAGAAVINPWS